MSGDDSYLQHCELLFEQILSEEGTRLPSARRYANRLRTPETGVQVRAPALSLCVSLHFLPLPHMFMCALARASVCAYVCGRVCVLMLAFVNVCM